MNYDDYNDYELISYVAENNEDAEKIIFDKYMPLVYSMANKTYRMLKKDFPFIQFNELYESAIDGLYSSIKNYVGGVNCNFSWYCKICISNSMKNFVSSYMNKKNMVNNTAFSLSDVDDMFIYNNGLFNDYSNPLNLMINEENETELYNNISSNLSKLEKDILDLKIKGYKNSEIVKILNVNLKSINNAFCRIRQKIKNNL